ncbi:uncharacterized protein LOC110861818 [Folsomia candida]|uniref:Transmembrane protein n=1 Tax=Folsomia candida TaxID=158441 RepID=A0A226D0Y6_FOLCA|nr:uncharacterized protein LOC110861818 [Folsomia candida]OXA38514.1 hypothetical protein Fcan01_26745 [Folsomia candida]
MPRLRSESGMPSFREVREIFVLGFCNLVVGPIIFIAEFFALPETDVENSNNVTDEELALEYDALLWAYISMIFCSFVSGLCAMWAVTVVRNDCYWEIKLGKVATFLAKALFFQNLAFIFYNLDPLEWRTKGGLLETWGQIDLLPGTCLYCVALQYYFARQIALFVMEAEKLVKTRQDIVKKAQRNRASN